VLEELDLYGRRNISLLTIPPTGSISILAGISSGMEPVFMLFYKRRRKLDITSDTSKASFIDEQGDAWEEYYVIHPGFAQWLKVVHQKDYQTMSEEELDKYAVLSPYAGSTANEIDPLKKVELQSIAQRYIDHAISITHNLPEKASTQDVYNLYIKSWNTVCKGCTVYRDVSRTGVLVSSKEEKKKEQFQYKSSFKRPKEVKCDVFHSTVQGIKYVVLVGIINGLPYEVFAFKYANSNVPLSLKTGFIVKKKSKHYHLTDENGKIIIDNIVDEMIYPSWAYVTRMISLSLRHGTDIAYVVDQLDDEFGIITDVSKVIARQLKRYISKQHAKTKGEICPNCGSKLTMEGGCKTCMNCGWSACG
jgi:ribonucleoside-diphosphate reductase alpha chain